MATLIRKRVTGKEEGFTLIELLVVIVILGILMAIAVPSYMGFRDRAQQRAAESNVRAAIPSVEAYYSDHNLYADDAPATFDAAWIRANIDTGLATNAVIATGADDQHYCVSDVQGSWVARVDGPGGQITSAKDGTVAACT